MTSDGEATHRKKLIEVALPLEAINRESAREKSIRYGHPSTLHLWWARRPLAAARAVLFAQLVDDPSGWPEEFHTEKAQEKERQRLFRVIEQLVKWENSNKPEVINAARLEIARSHARGSTSPKAKKILTKKVTPELVNDYLATELPPVHDPFAGGGTIPLEAQRLGLRAIATDLNPVAVLINKALIEIPPKFAGRPPVNPDARSGKVAGQWTGARGLADDVRYYGSWVREEARKKIGHLYPEVELPKEHGGGQAMVIAWLWVRTVPSPDPAFGGAHVPLVSSFWLSTKKGKEVWLKPVVDAARKTWRFEVVTGGSPKADDEREQIGAGTKTGRGDFRCLLSGSPMAGSYLREMGRAGRLGARMIAIVVESHRSRIYLPAAAAAESAAAVNVPDDVPGTELPAQALGFRIQNYGLTKHCDLFTPRQLIALTTFADLVAAARVRVIEHAVMAGFLSDDTIGSAADAAAAYGDAVATYLGLAIGKAADYNSSLVTWSSSRDQVKTTFTRQALAMVWDYAEVNPFASAAGDLEVSAQGVSRVVAGLCADLPGVARQCDARSNAERGAVITSSDPPYFDNVPYADLSDFFYIWLRRALGQIHAPLLSTILVPKDDELIAEPARHGGRGQAEAYFLRGMADAMLAVAARTEKSSVVTIYYAFKQTESDDGGASIVSTGWETFLEAVLSAGLSIEGTWPVRSERGVRTRSLGSNALASSIVLVCRRRAPDVAAVARSALQRELRRELPPALRLLQAGNIAPVDLPQAAIGPGMAIFSRHAKVLEPDGTSMTVRTALQLINEALDEYLTEQEGDFDPYTRFGLTWYEQHRWENGPFGEAENLAKARNIAVAGVAEAGFLLAKAGKVRLLKRAELPTNWDPLLDSRPTIWEATQHLIKRLETDGGERSAAELLVRLGPRAQPARDLAYRLYTLCERKKWADDALAYNTLVVAWPELQRMAEEQPAPTQQELL